MPDNTGNIKLHKVIIIIVYFGDWPWYFPYFLESCKYNSSISFVIFSDNDAKYQKLPDNVKLLDYSISQFNEDAARILGFEVNVRHAYKICDFKPAFGLIFQKYVSGSDFWGYCDIDLIYGNIRNFMTDELLNGFDIISARHDYLTGSFALYRNNSFMLNLFKHSKDYKKIFSDPRNYCFDETNYAFGPFFQGISYKNIPSEVESMTHVVRRLEEEKKIKPYFEFQIVEGFAGNLLWDSGKLVYRKKFEVLFYNLVRFKYMYSEENQLNVEMPYRFRISKSKFYAKRYK